MSLAGSWRIATPTEPRARTYGAHAYYFSPHGELVLSTGTREKQQRILLTWREHLGHVVIDQPSAPAEERMPLVRASEVTMQLGSSWYLRETGPMFDEEAASWALVAGGAWHGIASAHLDGPFNPFLLLETGRERQLRRILSASYAEAEESARDILAREAYERAVWVRDGRATLDGVKTDAIITTRYAPRGVALSDLALPYGFRDGVATILRSFHQQPTMTWPVR